MRPSTAVAPAPVLSSGPASFAVHLGFAVHGVVTTLLPPILPALGVAWALDDAQLGRLFTAQFVGSMAGVALSGVLVPRRGFRFTMVLGYLLMAGGVTALASATWPAGLACVLLSGIGIGLTIPASNVFVAETMAHRRAAAVNILNFAWTLGAIACPWIFVLANTSGSRKLVLWALAAAVASVAGWMLLVRWPAAAGEGGTEPARLSRTPHAVRALVALGALFALYVGSEAGLVGWIVSYSGRLSGGVGYGSIVTPSLFWAAVLLTRLAAPLTLRHVSEAALVRWGLALGTAGAAAVTWVDSLPGVMVAVTVVGLGFGMVFPLFVADMSQRFGGSAPRAASVLFAMSGVGGATLPWLVGVASTGFGSLKAGLIIPVAGGVAMLLVHLFALPEQKAA